MNAMKIDIVSDVVCPWCAIGLKSLETALARLDGQVSAELHFQPFELNPQMGPEGQDIVEHLSQKYGIDAEQIERNQHNIRERGASVGFRFEMDKRSRTYNTFDAHRLLHWAGLEGRQLPLKHALLEAYFTHGRNPGDHEVLVQLAADVGLDAARAREVLASGAYADEVKQRERFYLDHGIHSVPAVIVNDRHLISGGQPPEVFEQALRQIAAQG
ncbi:DsbA family oxidoreductase [Methylibium rhizosphaerae]|jgi:predicted DsbA family dithiol-disulfide isomerase|uniref:DsbA family oxidoreductase n=1 Tax=Methylibium rhizosphaerae TaxID=2570323 RepID=UPI001129D515|nr:DsbA family oxidoreductase [Methylibium rhizosphaerae]